MPACLTALEGTGPRQSAPARLSRIARLARLPAVVLAVSTVFMAGHGALADSTRVITNPVRVTVPAIGVDAGVQDVGLADDGSMGIPVGYEDVAWYQLGVDPGQPGFSAFTGHISSIYYPGVFYNIDELSNGNTIHVFGNDGSELVFMVQEVDRYPADSFPMNKIFAQTPVAGLVLITCGGDWDPVAHLFADRIVVFATLSTSG
jgi:sortase A